MDQRIENVHTTVSEQDDTIQHVRHEAEFGHAVLQQLSKVDHTPSLSFRNVISSTSGFTMLNCLVLTVCYSTATMAYTIPGALITFMVADLGRADLASWISTASTAATAAILPCMSSLTDVLGRRYTLLLGCAVGIAGSLVAGLAPSTKVLIVRQALNGVSIGFAFIAAAALAEIVPAFTRPFWGTLLHIMGALGQVLGPIYAGAIIRHHRGGWRWAFYVHAILWAVALLLLLFIYRAKSRVKALGLTNRDVAKRFDYIGLLLFTGGTVAFIAGLAWGGVARYGWHSTHAIAPTTVGLVTLLICLPLYEAYAPYPLIDRRLFKNRNFVVLNVSTFVLGFTEFSISVYFPTLLAAFWETDALKLGVDRVAFTGPILVSLIVSGMFLQRTGRYKWIYMFLVSTLLVGPAIFAVLRPNQSISVPLGLSVITGVGIGGATQVGLIVVQYSIPQQLLGISVGSLNTIRSFGGAVGVAIYNSIITSYQTRNLRKSVTAATDRAGASGTELAAIVNATLAKNATRIAQAAHGNLTLVRAATGAYKITVSDSYRLVFLTTIPFGVLALVITFWLQEVTEYMSDETVFGVKRDNTEGTKGIEELEKN